MRALLAALLTMALALPARAQQAPPEGPPPSFDEPTPKASPAPAAQETPSPPPAPVQETPAPAPASGPKVTADGYIEETIPNPSKKWGLAFAGAAAGCFLLGGILGGVALSRESEQVGDAKNPSLYTTQLLDRGKEAQAMANTAYAFFGIGAALAVVDVVLWIETFRKPRVIRKPASEVAATPTGTQF